MERAQPVGASGGSSDRTEGEWGGTALHPKVLDAGRVAALEATGLLDSLQEEAFDRLTRRVQEALGVPVALVSLVHRGRQFFKSGAETLPEPWASRRETPLSHSFCQIVVAEEAALTVTDSRGDPRVRGSAAIQDLRVIAYLGVPLHDPASGHVLGSLCAIDGKPRSWTEEETQVLLELSAQVMAEIGAAAVARGSADSELPTPHKGALTVGFGAWLRGERQARGLSLQALAGLAGVSAAALCRWEAGARGRPRSFELDQVLASLGLDARERMAVHSALGDATQVRRLWEVAWRESGPNPRSPAPPLSLPGDVLRDLRMRRGWTQARLAAHLGTNQGSVARWEASTDWPDAPRVVAACEALSANGREADLLLGWGAARTHGWKLTPPAGATNSAAGAARS
jgi:transcriptional regulator with XRE-family HTH domain